MRVCLLTNEVYPAQKGGIGRLMHNFCLQNTELGRPVDLHILLHGIGAEEFGHLRAHFAGHATLHRCPDLGELGDDMSRAFAADRVHHRDYAAHYRTAWACHQGLLKAEAASGGPFDVVEIPDFGGWGHAILAARNAGLAHRGSFIACRLHSSQGMITRAEPYSHQPSLWFGALFDMERTCIAGADLIVGHVPAVIDANAAHYGFGPDWRARTVAEFPPILLDAPPPAEGAEPEAPDFVFSSRLQPFKRPELFVRAAILFFERRPDYPGRALLLSYGWDEDYILWLKDQVPNALRDKVVFRDTYTAAERDAILSRAVIVIPSNYESLCLFAFEAAQMGRPVILARDCVAFGASDRWRDDHNCLMFDGSFADLADAMARAADGWRPRGQANAAADAPYWTDPRRVAARKASPAPFPGPVPILCHGVDSAHALNTLVLRHRTSALRDHPTHVIVPRDLVRPDAANLHFHAASGILPDPAEIAHIALSLDAPHILMMRADVELHPSFPAAAAHALAHDPNLRLVSTHLVVRNPSTPAEFGIRLATGDAATVAMQENAVAAPVALVATEAIRRFGFDSMARDLWWEAFTRRLALSGAPVLVLPAVLAEVPGSELAVPDDTRVSAGIADEAGRAAGLRPRLLGQRMGGARRQRGEATATFGLRELYRASLAWPQPNPRDFELVGIRSHLGGLLTHPVNGRRITAANLNALVPAPIRAVRVSLLNASDLNDGVEMALALAEQPLDEAGFRALERNEAVSGLHLSEWQSLAPGEGAERELPMPVDRPCRLYLFSRLPSHSDSDAYGWAIWKSVEFLR